MKRPGTSNLSINIPDKIYPIKFDQLYFKKPNINNILLEIFTNATMSRDIINNKNLHLDKYKLKYIMDKIDGIKYNEKSFLPSTILPLSIPTIDKPFFQKPTINNIIYWINKTLIKYNMYPIYSIINNGFYPMKIDQLYYQRYNINKILILYNMIPIYGIINGLIKVAIGQNFNIHIKIQHKFFLVKYYIDSYGSIIQGYMQQIEKIDDQIICHVNKYLYYYINNTKFDSNLVSDLDPETDPETDTETDPETNSELESISGSEYELYFNTYTDNITDID